MSTKPKKSKTVVPLKLPDDMRAKIRDLSTKSRLSDADIMRMAIDRGLTAVEKMFEQPAVKAA